MHHWLQIFLILLYLIFCQSRFGTEYESAQNIGFDGEEEKEFELDDDNYYEINEEGGLRFHGWEKERPPYVDFTKVFDLSLNLGMALRLNSFQVVAVEEGSATEAAGVIVGDYLLEVNGEATNSQSLLAITQAIRKSYMEQRRFVAKFRRPVQDIEKIHEDLPIPSSLYVIEKKRHESLGISLLLAHHHDEKNRYTITEISPEYRQKHFDSVFYSIGDNLVAVAGNDGTMKSTFDDIALCVRQRWCTKFYFESVSHPSIESNARIGALIEPVPEFAIEFHSTGSLGLRVDNHGFITAIDPKSPCGSSKQIKSLLTIGKTQVVAVGDVSMINTPSKARSLLQDIGKKKEKLVCRDGIYCSMVPVFNAKKRVVRFRSLDNLLRPHYTTAAVSSENDEMSKIENQKEKNDNDYGNRNLLGEHGIPTLSVRTVPNSSTTSGVEESAPEQLDGMVKVLYLDKDGQPEPLYYIPFLKALFSGNISHVLTHTFPPVVFSEPANACSRIINKPDMKDAVVVVERGQCMFDEKAYNVGSLGASAVLIVNKNHENDPHTIFKMPSPPEAMNNPFTMPVVMISNEAGNIIAQALKKKPLHAKFEV